MTDAPHSTGWVYRPDVIEAIQGSLEAPTLYQANPILKDSGKGKTAFLYKAVQKVYGYYPWIMQGTTDCVGESGELETDCLASCEIVAGDREVCPGETVGEAIYGGSRIQIGKGQLGAGGGSVVSWAAEWLQKYGVLQRKVYTLDGKTYDLTKYSGKRADDWGRRGVGVPEPLCTVAKNNPVEQFTFCKGWEDLRDGMANGFPGWIGSGLGFSTTRDKDGFIRQSGRWGHAWTVWAMKDDERPGAATVNSWGKDWVGGPLCPQTPDAPPWMAFIDAEVFDRIAKEGEIVLLSGFKGFPAKKRDWIVV